jgi:hypothetical protein
VPWVKKIEKHTLLNMKRIRGYSVITPISQHRKCVYWTKPIPQGGKQLELGSPQSINYMQQKNVSRFVVGSFGTFEVELFYLLKDKDQTWNAYRDDCDEMYRIDNIQKLNYDFVQQLIVEFNHKGSRSSSTKDITMN